MAKQAILVVSFGTAVDETLKKNIEALEQAVAMEFSGIPVRRAFTSEAVLRSLARRGMETDNVECALDRLLREGIRQVDILPTHLVPGGEYRKLLERAESYQEKFARVRVAQPLLWEKRDLTELAGVLLRAYPCRQGEALLLMGHGSETGGNEVFPMLERSMSGSAEHGFVAVMQGKPELSDALRRIQNAGYSAVRLVPLMLTAGIHVREHMAGDRQDSWKNRCLAAGLDVTCVLAGLGELPEVRSIYLRHLRESMLL